MADLRIKTENILANRQVVYRSVNDVLDTLRQIDEGKVLEEKERKDFLAALEKFLKEQGWKKEINVEEKGTRREIIEFLNRGQEKWEAKALNSAELEELIKEYEKAIERGEEEQTVKARFKAETGWGIEEFIKRQKEIFDENKARLEKEGISKAGVKRITEEMTIEEMALESQVGEELGRQVSKKIKEFKEIREVEKLRDELLDLTKRMERETKNRLIDAGVEMAARLEMVKAANKQAMETAKRLEQEGITMERDKVEEMLAKRIAGAWRQGIEIEETRVKQELAEMAENGKSERVRVKIGQEVRMIEEEMKAVERERQEIWEIERVRALRTNIEAKTAEANKKVSREEIKKYANFVVSFYKTNPVRIYRREVIEEGEKEGLSPGAVENGWLKTQALFSLLKKGKIKEKVQIFDRFTKVIPNLNAIETIGECRGVNMVMSNLRDSQALANFLSLRRIMAVMENPLNIIKDWQRGELNWGRRILTTRIRDWAKKASLMMAEGKSLGETIGLAIKGMSTRGAPVAVRFLAGKAAGGLLGGPVGVVIATVGGAIFKKLGGWLEKMGLSLGIKKWMRENLGNLPEAVMGIGVSLGAVVAVAGTAITMGAMNAAMALIGPVVVALVMGVFVYQMVQSSLISSVVPPAAMGGEGFEGRGVEVKNLPLPEWNTIIALPESCPQGWPVEGGKISQGPMAAGCSHERMMRAVDVAIKRGTKVRATHDGVARTGADSVYGMYVEVRAKCKGVEFVSRYAHLTKDTQIYKGDVLVKRGEVIGKVNNTGSSTGDHLHYDLRGELDKPIEYYLGEKEGLLQGCCNMGEKKCPD